MPETPSAHIDLVAALRAADSFSALPDGTLCELVAEMEVVSLGAGETVIQQDQITDKLWVVIEGTLAVSFLDRRDSSRSLPDLAAGGLIGEMNLFSTMAALTTVTARGPVRLGALTRAAFDRFAERCPGDALALVEALGPRLRRTRLWIALHISDAFREFDPDVLVDLESECELVTLYGGEVLLRRGECTDALFIVMNGRLRVATVTFEGREVTLAELGAGETVGEMALLSGEPRSANVYAMRDSQLARLTKASAERLLERHPQAMLRLLTGRLVSRLRNMSRGDRRDAAIATVAVIPAGPGAPLDAFADKLVAALGQLGRTRLLTSAIVDRDLGRRGASQAYDREGGGTRLLEWLAEQEVEHRYVVYQAEAALSPWTERCLRQADRIVIVADATGDPAPGAIESEWLKDDRVRRSRMTLVLVHGDAVSAPLRTARWLQGRTLERHLHVRLEQAGDVARVARFLTGSAVGLALGGGFARGLAHLGVLRALRELDIPIDALGGASMGAMVGAQWTLGWDASRIVHETCTGLAASFDDMTLPFLSFKRGGKYSRLVRRFFTDVQIEDLWLPYFCVSANLNRAELKVHTTGSLSEAVLASTRAPGIFPPVVMDGELHVDGGVINNVPVDVMKTFLSQGVVIGVDVSPPHELNQIHDYGHDVSGWRAIWHRFNPARDKRIYRPSILLVLMRVIEFGGISYRRQKAEMADVYISPDLLRFRRNDFHAAADIAEVGYRASHERLTQWLARDADGRRKRRSDRLFRSETDSAK
jgi:predicted acylesterase/phospholipase RssA/CRP-like cAMP-binding protein